MTWAVYRQVVLSYYLPSFTTTTPYIHYDHSIKCHTKVHQISSLFVVGSKKDFRRPSSVTSYLYVVVYINSFLKKAERTKRGTTRCFATRVLSPQALFSFQFSFLVSRLTPLQRYYLGNSAPLGTLITYRLS